ncbi:MAG: hypothetical protein ABSB35_11845 [Bryobacteraceae bacterium]
MLAAEWAAARRFDTYSGHITTSVELYGLSGFYIYQVWKEKIVDIAAGEIATLQQDVGTKAERRGVITDSGNTPHLLSRAAEQTTANVLVFGHIPGAAILGNTATAMASFGSRTSRF